jgi:hypothetical protein
MPSSAVSFVTLRSVYHTLSWLVTPAHTHWPLQLQTLVGVVLPVDAGSPWLVLEQGEKGRLDRFLRRHKPKSDVLVCVCVLYRDLYHLDVWLFSSA